MHTTALLDRLLSSVSYIVSSVQLERDLGLSVSEIETLCSMGALHEIQRWHLPSGPVFSYRVRS